MKFRSILYLVVSICSLGISVPLAKLYGGIGCALGTAFALVIGQIIIMNIYYHKRVGLDMIAFWKEIGKMSVIPIVLSLLGCLLLYYVQLDSWGMFVLIVFVFSVVYIFLFWFKGMNQYERDLFMKPIQKMQKKIYN